MVCGDARSNVSCRQCRSRYTCECEDLDYEFQTAEWRRKINSMKERKTMKAFIIGSVTSSKHDIINAERVANSLKYVTSRPIFPGERGGDVDKVALIARAIELIHESDLVVVVPKPDGTYGDYTLFEWSLAKFWEKEIVIWDVNKED